MKKKPLRVLIKNSITLTDVDGGIHYDRKHMKL